MGTDPQKVSYFGSRGGGSRLCLNRAENLSPYLPSCFLTLITNIESPLKHYINYDQSIDLSVLMLERNSVVA